MTHISLLSLNGKHLFIPKHFVIKYVEIPRGFYDPGWFQAPKSLADEIR